MKEHFFPSFFYRSPANKEQVSYIIRNGKRMTLVVHYVPLFYGLNLIDSGHGHSWNRFNKVTWKTLSTILSRSILWQHGGGGHNSFCKVYLRKSEKVDVANQVARGWRGNHFSVLLNFFLFISSNCGKTLRAIMYSALIYPFYDPSH